MVVIAVRAVDMGFGDRLPRERGNVEGAPKTLRELCDWFKGRSEFEAVQVFAFPVTDDRK